MGNEEEATPQQTLEEQKSIILPKAEEITERIIAINEDIKSIQKGRQEKEKKGV